MASVSAADWGHAQDQIARWRNNSYDQRFTIQDQQIEIDKMRRLLYESQERVRTSQEAYDDLLRRCGEPSSSRGQQRKNAEEEEGGDGERSYDIRTEKNKEPAEGGD